MCQVKNIPIDVKYCNKLFGNVADSCLVEVINYFNKTKDIATVASCCGHDGKAVPYLTTIQPKEIIKDVKKCLGKYLGWDKIRVDIWKDMPDGAKKQLGDFIKDKFYVGYYNTEEDFAEDLICINNSERFYV